MLRSSPRPLSPRSVPHVALTYVPSQPQSPFGPFTASAFPRDLPQYPVHTVQARGLSLLRSPACFSYFEEPSPFDNASPTSTFASSTIGTPDRGFSYDPSDLLVSSPSTPGGSPALLMSSNALEDFRRRQLFVSPSPSQSPASSPSARPRIARRKAVSRIRSMAECGPTSSPEPQTGARQSRARKSKGRKSRTAANGPALLAPLSVLTHGWTTPIKDTADYVARPVQQRRQEAVEKGKITRAMNCFILYRRAYSDRASQYCEDNAQPSVSDLLGKSWRMETDLIRRQYQLWADEEAAGHRKAFPEYTYKPSNANRMSTDAFEHMPDATSAGGAEDLAAHDSPLMKTELPATPSRRSTNLFSFPNGMPNELRNPETADTVQMPPGGAWADQLYPTPEAEQVYFIPSPEMVYGRPDAGGSIYEASAALASSPLPVYGSELSSVYGGSFGYGSEAEAYVPGEPLPSSSAYYVEQPRTRFWRDADELGRYDEQVDQIAALCPSSGASQTDQRVAQTSAMVDSDVVERAVAAEVTGEQNDAALFEFCNF